MEAKVNYTETIIGNNYPRVDLINKHRVIATDMSVFAVKNELQMRNSHR